MYLQIVMLIFTPKMHILWIIVQRNNYREKIKKNYKLLYGTWKV
jgi:hypothetical protein